MKYFPNALLNNEWNAPRLYGTKHVITLVLPIYIKNSVSGNVITTKIYSSEEYKDEISVITKVEEEFPSPITRINNDSLYEGTTKTTKTGRSGYTISTHRVYTDEHGEEITEYVDLSYYPPTETIIEVGTKKRN